jgi:large subunit ribosomal protein L21
MFAVLKTGGKQYRVEMGTELEIEKISGDKGAKATFEEVLLVADGENIKIGSPLVTGARVTAEIVSQTKGPKEKIFKKTRRKGRQLHKGHRQSLTRIRVLEIAA